VFKTWSMYYILSYMRKIQILFFQKKRKKEKKNNSPLLCRRTKCRRKFRFRATTSPDRAPASGTSSGPRWTPSPGPRARRRPSASSRTPCADLQHQLTALSLESRKVFSALLSETSPRAQRLSCTITVVLEHLHVQRDDVVRLEGPRGDGFAPPLRTGPRKVDLRPAVHCSQGVPPGSRRAGLLLLAWVRLLAGMRSWTSRRRPLGNVVASAIFYQ